MRVLHPTPLRWSDWVFLLGWTAFFVAARTWNLADMLSGPFMKGAS